VVCGQISDRLPEAFFAQPDRPFLFCLPVVAHDSGQLRRLFSPQFQRDDPFAIWRSERGEVATAEQQLFSAIGTLLVNAWLFSLKIGPQFFVAIVGTKEEARQCPVSKQLVGLSEGCGPTSLWRFSRRPHLPVSKDAPFRRIIRLRLI